MSVISWRRSTAIGLSRLPGVRAPPLDAPVVSWLSLEHRSNVSDSAVLLSASSIERGLATVAESLQKIVHYGTTPNPLQEEATLDQGGQPNTSFGGRPTRRQTPRAKENKDLQHMLLKS